MLEHVTIEPEGVNSDEQENAVLVQLQQFKNQKGYCYDPARLRFIESLFARAKNENKRVQQLLERKAQQALENYQADLAAKRSNAESLLAEIKKNGPDRVEQAQQYFEQDDFDRLKRVFHQARFDRHSRTHLAALTETLLNGSENPDQSRERQLNELLLQQEINALGSVENNRDKLTFSAPSLSKQKPLKANLRYQQVQREQHVNHLMTSLMAAKPSNPGPLNPERLAIELLREMYSLSPEYFNHCLVNIETLLWLEKQQKTTNKK